MNHSKQVDKFVLLCETVKALKFRIQISSEKIPNSKITGFWLLKSLINSLNLDDLICADLSLVDTFKYKGKPQDILDGISDKLKLGFEPGVCVEKLINKIYEKMLLEEQYILLLFCGVDFQTKSTLDKILKDFWLRLTEKIQKPEINHYLLMCWIDCKNKIDWRTSYEFLDDPKKYLESKKPETLFDISVTPKFGKEDLKRWLKEHDGRTAILKLNADLVKEEHRNKTIEQFWTKSKGEPEKLLKEIYTSCKLCWEDYEDKWQKFR